MGGEDFGFLALDIPAAFLVLGQGSGEEEGAGTTTYGLHNPRFNLHERVLKTGAALHAHLAFQSLEELHKAHARQILQVGKCGW
jgi:metal-dependent amidase/aminoacylase/carboxypeptidase family protein